MSKKGYKQTEEHRKNLSKSQTGVKRKRLKMKPQSLEHRTKISKSRLGDKHWNWQGGKTQEIQKLRTSLEYKEWRKSVFIRDGFKCVLCDKKGYLEADHIKPFAHYPKLRFKLSNGRTLCKDCHKNTPTYKTGSKIVFNNQYTKLTRK